MLKSLLLERHLTHTQAAIYAIFGYFLFSVSDVMGKWLMHEGYDKSHILVLNSIPSTVVFLAIMIKRRGLSRCLHTPYKFYHVLRALTLLCVTYFVFNALERLPMADYYGVAFSAPLILTIGAFLVFREKVDIFEWLAILIGFGGVLLVVNPEFGGFNIGYVYAFLGVVAISSAGLICRKIGRDEDPFLFVLFGNFAVIGGYVYSAITIPMPDILWTHIAVLGVYAVTIPAAIMTVSAVFARAPAVTAVAPFQYLQIIWGTVLGYILFSDIPQINTVIGSGIVILTGLFILFHHKRKSRCQIESELIE